MIPPRDRDPRADDGNAQARRAWEANAGFWDERMSDGNDFFEELLWPAVERLLAPRPGQRLLDVACGNGVASRRLAGAGARVVAFDFAAALIARARARGGDVDYRVLDATDAGALATLGGQGEDGFDGALCNMAIMDIAAVEPLFAGVAKLLAPGGAFVFSTMHPCFNNPSVVQIGELEDRDGDLVTTYAVKTSRYMTPFSRLGLAMHGQPEPHPYFHRPLGALLGAGFAAGFVLDGLEERAFPPEHAPATTPLSWSGRFHEIPPVLVARLRKPGAP